MSSNVQTSIEAPLPSLVKEEIEERASSLLSKHNHRFGSAELQIHVKTSGRRLECSANLFTDQGRYHTNGTGWNILALVGDLLNTLETQILKREAKRAAVEI
ncbi:hypothetical protein GOV11_02815 [Candidatus Woesearchaeota archaeon]|nr:hypothetical protein [Candidatus Woesearchaeota archaeon]